MSEDIFIFVEGPDDFRFMDKILKPLLEQIYNLAIIIEYSKESNDRLENFINSLNRNYLVFADYDEREVCITNNRLKIMRRFNNSINVNNIIIVIREIEGWYLAGLNKDDLLQLGIKIGDTNNVTKRDFNKIIPRKDLKYKNIFLSIILNKYKRDEAKANNRSFQYCCNKINNIINCEKF